MINMINLSAIGMEKGKQYETIVSTSDINNVKNAAPIGIICSGENQVICRIFKGGKTLENILSEKEFVINITQNPELFFKTTIGNLDGEYFNDDNSIKNVDAYVKCKVISFKEAIKQSDPIKKKGEAIVIKSKVCEIIINNNIKALNRGFGYVIESLSNLTRIDLVNDDKKNEYINNFKEAYRIVVKVGYKKDIEAMKLIKRELIKKGFNL